MNKIGEIGKDLDIDLLRTFVVAAEMGGFTLAGKRLRISQSTVSLQMKRLEDSIGKQLFERRGRSIALTIDGEVLLKYARQILRLSDEVRSRMSEPEVSGLVRLGTPEDFATTHLPDVLARFAKSHPYVALEVTCDFTLNLMDRFSRGEFDLMLIKREPQGPAGGNNVWREPLVWAGADGTEWGKQDPVPLVVAPQPDVYRSRAMKALDEIDRKWRIAYTSPSLAGIQAAIKAGLGVSVLPKEMVPEGMHMMGTEDHFPELEDTEIALYKAPSDVSPAAQRLADYVSRALEVSPAAPGTAAE